MILQLRSGMDITQGYAVALGGVLATLALASLLPTKSLSSFSYLPPIARPPLRRAVRYLIYPYVLRRHQFLGPWTWADVMVQLVYITGNAFCVGFRSSFAEAGLRSGSLSLINLIPLYLGPHLGFLADLLGLSLSTFRRVHRSAGLLSSCLVLFHALAVINRFTLGDRRHISAVVASILITIWFPLTYYRPHRLLGVS